jgi:hypothetical protein
MGLCDDYADYPCRDLPPARRSLLWMLTSAFVIFAGLAVLAYFVFIIPPPYAGGLQTKK